MIPQESTRSNLLAPSLPARRGTRASDAKNNGTSLRASDPPSLRYLSRKSQSISQSFPSIAPQHMHIHITETKHKPIKPIKPIKTPKQTLLFLFAAVSIFLSFPCMMNRHGSYARTTATVQKKQLKAKNPHNQIGLDKLLEVQEKASSNPNSNFILTVKRGIKSLQSCPTAITTRKEACQLKYVGPALAKIICPTQFTTPTNANASETSFSTTTNTANPSRTQATSTTSTATTKVEQGPTKKEKTYQAEKLAAESLDVSKCGHWKVILIVDGREHKSKHVVSKCKQSGIPCEERHLPIGDMTWIAQSKDKSTGKLVEVLCGTIIERKESSDLVSSLFGTRYLEQRLRLQHCGLPQLLFLVEGGLNTNVNCPQETLEMAIMETRCLGFHVMQTEHLQDTVRQLKGLHRRIVQRTFPDAFRSELPTYTNSPTEAIGNRRRRRRPSSLLEMVFDTSPKAPLGTKRFLTYTELKAKVEMDREAGTRTIGAVYMAMRKLVEIGTCVCE
jgi:ERCC4-type nuclease